MGVKMDKTMIIVCAVIGSLGLLSAILGFSAEGTKLTTLVILFSGCYHPANSALALGICAAVFLALTQITVAAVGGCCGLCKSRALPSANRRIIGIVCAVISWVAAAIAFGLFLEGASLNPSDVIDDSCLVVKPGIFAGAALLALVATALGLTSYIMLRSEPEAAAPAPAPAPNAGGQPPQAGIAMGQPQFPPPQGHGQAPSYPQYSPPPQGYGQQAPIASPPQMYGQAPPNQQFSPPPAQGYGSPAPNQQFYPPPPAQGYGSPAANQQFSPPPPAQGYGSNAPNQQYAPPPPAHDQGYGSHAPNQQYALLLRLKDKA